MPDREAMTKPASGPAADLHKRGVRYWIRCLLLIVLLLGTTLLLTLCIMMAYAAGLTHPVTFDDEAAKGISCEPWQQIIPAKLPSGFSVMGSNNNVDVVQHKDMFYLAFRTAPTHFASKMTRLVVLRSQDRRTWDVDHEIHTGRDLREPRFLAFGGKLFLHYFQGGTSIIEFAPESSYVTERDENGQWSAPKAIYKPGYVAWRSRVRGDTAYMSVYSGVGLYTTAERPGDLRLLSSQDGYSWTPISKDPQIVAVGAEEGEFDFDAEGNLYATIRLETGGGLVCRADKSDLSKWKSVFTPYKYDSALMFRRDKDFYLIARRNVAGPFASGGEFLPRAWQRGWWLARYSMTRKRTTLYKLDTTHLALLPLFDFPSKGDTAFAGVAPLDRYRYWVVNYSCRLDGPDWSWILGQFAGTQIYSTEMTFSAS